MSAIVKPFFHQPSFTLSYVVSCPNTKMAVIIDPPLDFDQASGQISFHSAQQIIDYVKQQGLTVLWLLETHAHADHLSAAEYLKQQLNAPTAIGEGITHAQKTFKSVLNLNGQLPVNGSQFDRLLKNGDNLELGELTIHILATAGHTNDSITYVIGNNAFVGDTLFMPDSGTARCDFPGGDASLLFDSIAKIYALGDDTVLWMCHDYQPNGRALGYKTTVAQQKAGNIHVTANTSKSEFVQIREQRDATLAIPQLLYPAVQVNINAGALPPAEQNHSCYLKIPIFWA